ncbi:DNA repair exonuclease [Roseomonas sp. E05]|uniref:metallophosphoesterase family protein n=1 Tax=Roseomonas sp. E05 TaxID=3046310 RepID=UPI0024BACAE3|nr:DNA repair exonuclease [Roseomonas sp. E05]MDJ0390591.1 DNA repair exonuclease [Roseomonas sp. E05]
MTSFRFLHAADLHLDSPLRGLDADLDAPARRIRRASREALANLVDLAIAEAVDFVVIAGDLYDGDWQDFRTGQALVAALARLTRAGVRVIAIRGNHDAESVLTRNLRLPEGATLLSARAPQTLRLPEIGVAVHGQSFATRDVQENLARDYPVPLPGLFNLGLLHTAATGRPGHAGYAPCTVEQLAGHGYDYWALGHIHTREELLRDPWIVFPGNLQGRHVNEPGAKGATLVTVRDGRVAEVAHRALDTVRWQRLAVDCSGAADLEQVLSRVRHALGTALGDVGGRLLALRLALEGDCAAHAALARDPLGTRERVRAAGLEVAEEDAFWIEAVRIGTHPPSGSAIPRPEGDAVGRLLGAIEALSGGAESTALTTAVQSYAAALLDRAGGLREALGAEHPAVLAAEGHLPAELLQRARQLLLSRLSQD